MVYSNSFSAYIIEMNLVKCNSYFNLPFLSHVRVSSLVTS